MMKIEFGTEWEAKVHGTNCNKSFQLFAIFQTRKNSFFTNTSNDVKSVRSDVNGPTRVQRLDYTGLFVTYDSKVSIIRELGR